ncbi:Sn1-specific diacylglycerol lipase beta [Staphylotrichum tortipilum]|uniref:sn-1-specific diacylglycerol lipase n=1 Tax=Staphylotrichum tortipilum TaxID=2831512 RepID=A0AAN6MJX7_9PEZI|nr:Sn1-specific diacylglycerol lipase beta [Staphylotrichum longicolle]
MTLTRDIDDNDTPPAPTLTFDQAPASPPPAHHASSSGSPLLPAPVAHLVSLATQSTGLAVRIGTAVGGYGLDVVRVTTLSTLQLSRAVLDGVLTRVAKDTALRTHPRLDKDQAEAGLERTIEKLHATMDQAVLWAAAGFHLTSASLSALSDTSQLLLATVDQLFGSTDSSRAVMSIITMVRREFSNPAMGGHGETVGVAELVLALCTLAYLQRSCRAKLAEESRAFGVEEVVWDVVVLKDGVRADIVEASHHPPGQPMTALQHLDHLPTRQLGYEIAKSLPDNAKVSISREIAISETIRVNIIGDEHQFTVEPPPGVELIEETRDTYQGQGAEVASSQLVFQHARRHERIMSFETGEGQDTGRVLGYLEGLDPRAPEGRIHVDSEPPFLPPATSSQLVVSSAPHDLPTPVTSSSTLLIESGDNVVAEPSRALESVSSSSETEIRPSRVSRPSSSANRKRSTSRFAPKGGFRSVLKRSISVLHKEDSPPGAAAGKMKQALATSLTTKNPRPPRSAWGRTGASPVSPKLKPEALAMTPSHLPSSAGYLSVHESRRQSEVSPDERHSLITTDDHHQIASFTENTGSILSENVRSETLLSHTPAAARTHPHHRPRPPTPSIYTLAVSKSVTSLISYHTTPCRPTSPSRGAIPAQLRQTGLLPGAFPRASFLSNLARYMRFASAAYGSSFLQVMGISRARPPPTTEDIHTELRYFAHHTGSSPESILLSSFVDPAGGSDSSGAINVGLPLVHYISLDHEAKAVVLTCRGTLGFEDVLADVACEYDTLVWQGRGYKVHKGVHASAKRILYGDDGRVLGTLRAALEVFGEYGVVLAGHSLGGAVTALLGVMLAEPNTNPYSPNCTPFVTSSNPLNTPNQDPPLPHQRELLSLPPNRPIHVYAYGPPPTLSPSLRRATRGLITTVVHGADVVPHLSLGVVHDMQGVALAVKGESVGVKREGVRRVLGSVLGGVAGRGKGGDMDGGGDGRRDDNEDWSFAKLKILRVSMLAEKLVPPGEVFVVERTAVLRREAFVGARGGSASRFGGAVPAGVEEHLGRPAHRVVVKYVRDVERRFGEVRFAGGMLTDHNPGLYEAALERLVVGVGV